MNITIKDYLHSFVRPLIGDILTDNSNTLTKYSDDYLLILYNEGVRDIARLSKIFRKRAYFLVSVNTSSMQFKLPADFRGVYAEGNNGIYFAATKDTRLREGIKVMVNDDKLTVEGITRSDIIGYQREYMIGAIDREIISYLVTTGQIVLTPEGELPADALTEKAILAIYYLFLPNWEGSVDNLALSDEDTLIALRYYVGAKALESDLVNEAQNIAVSHYKYYRMLVEDLGKSYHNWNNIDLSTYRGDI